MVDVAIQPDRDIAVVTPRSKLVSSTEDDPVEASFPPQDAAPIATLRAGVLFEGLRHGCEQVATCHRMSRSLE
jgi:hypothetical protein